METRYAQFILTLHSLLSNTSICKKHSLNFRLSALPCYDSLLQIYERKHFFLWKVFVHPHLEVFISVACKLSVDLVSTRPPFVYSWLKNFINDLIEFVPVCTWFGWLLHISFTCQSPLIYAPSAKLLLSKNGATELSSKSSYWLNYSKTSWYVLGCLQTDEFMFFCPYPLLAKPLIEEDWACYVIDLFITNEYHLKHCAKTKVTKKCSLASPSVLRPSFTHKSVPWTESDVRTFHCSEKGK